jgi:hypothetical protein
MGSAQLRWRSSADSDGGPEHSRKHLVEGGGEKHTCSFAIDGLVDGGASGNTGGNLSSSLVGEEVVCVSVRSSRSSGQSRRGDESCLHGC